jgi:hypothetical protein
MGYPVHPAFSGWSCRRDVADCGNKQSNVGWREIFSA